MLSSSLSSHLRAELIPKPSPVCCFNITCAAIGRLPCWLQRQRPKPAAACLQDLLLAVLVETDDIKLAPNHGEMPSLLARVKPSALVKHVQLQKVPPPAPACTSPAQRVGPHRILLLRQAHAPSLANPACLGWVLCCPFHSHDPYAYPRSN